jgi:hypothetical protein
MATNAETIAISQALLALSTAIDEIIDAQLALVPEGDSVLKEHLDTANAAVTQSLEHIQRLLSLIEKTRV